MDYTQKLYESYHSICQYILDNETLMIMESYKCLCEALDTGNVNDILNVKAQGILEAVNDKNVGFLTSIKNMFGAKHDKIVERDAKWVNSNKKKLLALNFDEIELEVPSDHTVTFANLLNRHDNFDKNYKGTGSYDEFSSKIKRFEDKNGNLKNGLDNYYRTNNSRREIGLRKVSGKDAKVVVANMISYCEDFLSGQKHISAKIDKLEKELRASEKTVKESYSYLFEGYFAELGNTSFNYLLEAAGEDPDVDKEIDDLDVNTDESEDTPQEPKKEEIPVDGEEANVSDENKILRDRQTGITVLMTIAEERYFDYIQILKELK